jgi:hypothetical protein
MRIAFVILCLAAIAAGKVYLRQEELRANYETQQFQIRRIAQRRLMWDQSDRMNNLASLEHLEARAQDLGIVAPPPTRPTGTPGTGRTPSPSRSTPARSTPAGPTAPGRPVMQ